MGRSSESWQQKKELEERVSLERAEATYYAIPDALHKNLETTEAVHKSQLELVQENIALREQVVSLRSQVNLQNRPAAKWKERGFGFLLGCVASVVASVIWWQMAKQFPVFR